MATNYNFPTAPLNSPAFTGVPTAPTAATSTNTIQIATTAYVIGQANSTAGTIAMNGTQAAGTSALYARADHVHPTDTTRAPLASPAFTGVPTAPTATAGTNTTQIATTAFVAAATAGSSGWSLTGNAGTTAGTNFFGTTDNTDYVFKRNSIISGRVGLTNTSYGESSQKVISTGTNNTSFGAQSLSTVTTGPNNTAFGFQSLKNLATGNTNAAFGTNAGSVYTANSSTFVGHQAASSLLSGNANVFIGCQTLLNGTYSDTSTIIGFQAGFNQNGSQNLAIGYGASLPNTSGAYQLNIGNVLWGANCYGTGTTPQGNLSIGTNTPDNSALFDLVSTTQGLGLPAMTDTQIRAIAAPRIGLLAYNTTLDCLVFFSAAGWRKVSHTVM